MVEVGQKDENGLGAESGFEFVVSRALPRACPRHPPPAPTCL